jgi:hypothetical protein
VVARSDLRFAGLTAMLTSALLVAHLSVYGGGPATDHSGTVLTWHAEHLVEARVASILWLAAMLSMVVFAIAFREAMWTSIIHRGWVSQAFVQGAGVFAMVAVVWAALGWALAGGAAAGTLDASQIGLLWAMQDAVLLFAMWGLVVPLLLVGFTMAHHSFAGQVCMLLAVAVSAMLVIPLMAPFAMYAVAGWIALTGLVLTLPAMRREARTSVVDHDQEQV